MLLPSLSSLLTPEPNLFPLGRAGKGKTSPTLLLPIKPALGRDDLAAKQFAF